MSKSKFSAVVLLCDSLHGVYLPMHWAWNTDLSVWGIDPEDENVLKAGPDCEWYWETWDDVLGYARYTDKAGNVFCLYQDGDLWAICYEKMTDEQRVNFGFDPE